MNFKTLDQYVRCENDFFETIEVSYNFILPKKSRIRFYSLKWNIKFIAIVQSRYDMYNVAIEAFHDDVTPFWGIGMRERINNTMLYL